MSVQRIINGCFVGGAFLAVLGVHQLAEAHIRMTMPTSRHPIPEQEDNSFLKDAPCGGLGDSRTTDLTRVTTFAPGEVVTIEWHETIHHASHYRIAFDADGQDDFNDPLSESDIVEPAVLPILLDGIPDKSDSEDSFSVQVTLPMTPCDNCTLQLMQYMYDREDPFYYQCADIVIVADPSDPLPGTGGMVGAITGGSPGVTEPPSTGGMSTGAPIQTTGGTTGGTTGAMNPQMLGTDSEEATGCSVSGVMAHYNRGFVGVFFAIWGGALVRRRRRAA